MFSFIPLFCPVSHPCSAKTAPFNGITYIYLRATFLEQKLAFDLLLMTCNKKIQIIYKIHKCDRTSTTRYPIKIDEHGLAL